MIQTNNRSRTVDKRKPGVQWNVQHSQDTSENLLLGQFLRYVGNENTGEHSGISLLEDSTHPLPFKPITANSDTQLLIMTSRSPSTMEGYSSSGIGHSQKEPERVLDQCAPLVNNTTDNVGPDTRVACCPSQKLHVTEWAQLQLLALSENRRREM